MKANKTPMQEFIEYFIRNSFMDETKILVLYSEELREKLVSWKQKEKQFAFECFEAGRMNGFDACHSIEWGDKPNAPDFEQFYSQYDERESE